MNGATLVEQFYANILSLAPFLIVKSYQRGVRWTIGRNPKELMPGPRWRVPVMHSVMLFDVVDEVIDLPIQSVITADKKLVCFSVNVAFRVVDVVQHACNVQDFFESTAGTAQTHLAKRVREKPLDELERPEGLKDLETKLRDTLTTKMKRW